MADSVSISTTNVTPLDELNSTVLPVVVGTAECQISTRYDGWPALLLITVSRVRTGAGGSCDGMYCRAGGMNQSSLALLPRPPPFLVTTLSSGLLSWLFSSLLPRELATSPMQALNVSAAFQGPKKGSYSVSPGHIFIQPHRQEIARLSAAPFGADSTRCLCPRLASFH
jgi:hypothetical protein